MDEEILEIKEQARILNSRLQKLETRIVATQGDSGIPISQLPEVSTIGADAVVPIVQDATTSKINASYFNKGNNVKVFSFASQDVYTLTQQDLTHDIFIIDEGVRSYREDTRIKVVIPELLLDASLSKSIRFLRKTGVTLTSGVLVESGSIRVTIVQEEDGQEVFVGDLIYGSEYIEVFVQYVDGVKTDFVHTHKSPQGKLSFSSLDPTSSGGVLGVPCSQLFYCKTSTEDFNVTTVFLVNIGLYSENNPFFRSFPPPDATIFTLNFRLKNETGYTNVSTDYYFAGGNRTVMFSSSSLSNSTNVHAAPYGGHFLRANQSTDDGGDYFYPDTTAEHRHEYYEAFGSTSDYANDNISYTASTNTGFNTGNRSYETAGRWAAAYIYIYL